MSRPAYLSTAELRPYEARRPLTLEEERAAAEADDEMVGMCLR